MAEHRGTRHPETPERHPVWCRGKHCPTQNYGDHCHRPWWSSNAR